MAKGAERSVRGVVIPTAWDAQGRVVAAGLSADDEQEYLLEQGPLASELLAKVRQEVEVRGRVTVRSDGVKTIGVESYRVSRRGERDGVA